MVWVGCLSRRAPASVGRGVRSDSVVGRWVFRFLRGFSVRGSLGGALGLGGLGCCGGGVGPFGGGCGGWAAGAGRSALPVGHGALARASPFSGVAAPSPRPARAARPNGMRGSYTDYAPTLPGVRVSPYPGRQCRWARHLSCGRGAGAPGGSPPAAFNIAVLAVGAAGYAAKSRILCGSPSPRHLGGCGAGGKGTSPALVGGGAGRGAVGRAVVAHSSSDEVASPGCLAHRVQLLGRPPRQHRGPAPGR